MSPSQFKRLHPWMSNMGRNTVLAFMWDAGVKPAPNWHQRSRWTD